MSSHETKAPNWNPYQTFVWTTEQLKNWYDTYGACGFYNGIAWKPVTKSLGVDRHSVRFIKD